MAPLTPRDPYISILDLPHRHIPKLAVRNRIDTDDVNTSNPADDSAAPTEFEQWRDEYARKAANTATAGQNPDASDSLFDHRPQSTKPTKKLAGVLGFITLKEPSTTAWEEYAQQQKLILKDRAIPFADKKLPADIPKVNSKWDGMPTASTHSRDGSGSSWSRSSNTSNQKSTDFPPTTARSPTGSKLPASALRKHSPPRNRPGESSTLPSATDASYLGPESRQSHESTIRPQSLATLKIVQKESDADLDQDRSGVTPTRTDHALPRFDQKAWTVTGKEASQVSTRPNLLPITQVTVQSTSASSAAASGTSSPHMPSTPDELAPAFRYTAVDHSQDSSIESGHQWPLSHELTSFGPPIRVDHTSTQTKIQKRPSVESLLAKRAESGHFSYPSNMDGTSAIKKIPSSTASPASPSTAKRSAITNLSRPRTTSSKSSTKATLEDGKSTSAWYSSDEEEEVDHTIVINSNVNAVKASPRSTPSPRNVVLPKPSFSRPRPTAGRPQSPSTPSLSRPTSSSHTPTRVASPIFSGPSSTTGSPIPSFSRPIPITSRSPEPAPAPVSTMGTISIVRNNQPLYTNPNFGYSYSSSTTSPYIPPRFQPGRVKVKDSDLDTIAESDSLHSASQRASYINTFSEAEDTASFVDAIPVVPLGNRLHRDLVDPASLRTSMTFSESEPDNDNNDDDDDDDNDDDEASDVDYETEIDETDYGYRFDQDSSHERSASSYTDRDVDDASIAESRLSIASNMSEQWYMSPRERLGLGGFIRHTTRDSPWPEDDPSPGAAGSALGLLSVYGDSAKSSSRVSTSVSGRVSASVSGRASISASGRRTPTTPSMHIPSLLGDELKMGKEKDGSRRSFFGVLKKSIVRQAS